VRNILVKITHFQEEDKKFVETLQEAQPHIYFQSDNAFVYLCN